MARVIRQIVSPPKRDVRPRTHISRRVTLPRYMEDALAKSMEKGNYTKKQRSLWIEEALAGLVLYDPAIYESATGDRTKAEKASVRSGNIWTKTNVRIELDNQIQLLLAELKVQNPDIQGHYSYIIRCSIRHRLRYPDLYPRTSPVSSEEIIDRALKANLSFAF